MAGNPYQRGSISGAPVSGVAVSGGDFTSDAIAATLSLTQGADGVSATATLALAAAAALTQGADSTSSAATLALVSAVGVTQGADTLSATGGAPPVMADLSVTQGADSMASASILTIAATLARADFYSGVSGYAVSSSAVSGTYYHYESGAIIQIADSISATATLALRAEATITQGADTLLTPATLLISGTASMTQGADTMASAATRTQRRTLNAISYGAGPRWRLAA